MCEQRRSGVRCHRFNVTSLSIWPATGVSPVLRHLERYTVLKLAYFLSGASVSSFSDSGDSVARQSNRLAASMNCWITFVLNTPAPAVQTETAAGRCRVRAGQATAAMMAAMAR